MGSMDNLSNIENYANGPRKIQSNSIHVTEIVNTNPNVVKPKLFNNSTNHNSNNNNNNNNSSSMNGHTIGNNNNLNSSLTDLTNLANGSTLGSSPLVEEQEDALIDHETKSVIIHTLMWVLQLEILKFCILIEMKINFFFIRSYFKGIRIEWMQAIFIIQIFTTTIGIWVTMSTSR